MNKLKPAPLFCTGLVGRLQSRNDSSDNEDECAEEDALHLVRGTRIGLRWGGSLLRRSGGVRWSGGRLRLGGDLDLAVAVGCVNDYSM
jgi:hypothetical protein